MVYFTTYNYGNQMEEDDMLGHATNMTEQI